jgi:hypothetical protein
MTRSRHDRRIAVEQTVRPRPIADLCIFAAAYFADRGPWLFIRGREYLRPRVQRHRARDHARAIIALRAVIQSPEPKAGGHLVTRGIYARLRHPIYTAT